MSKKRVAHPEEDRHLVFSFCFTFSDEKTQFVNRQISAQVTTQPP